MISDADSTWVAPDSWLVVLEMNDDVTHVDPGDEGCIDAAVTRYLDSGCTRDEVLCLTLSEGGRYHIRASMIKSWWVNTPEHQRRNFIRGVAQKEAERALRAALGLPWKENDD